MGGATTVAVVEESLFRGVVFRVAEEFAGTRAALLVPAAFVGIAVACAGGHRLSLPIAQSPHSLPGEPGVRAEKAAQPGGAPR